MAANVYLAEYTDIRANAALEPLTAQQKILTTGASQSFTAFGVNTQFIRIHTDNIMSFKIGAAPSAATTDARMAAGQTEYFKVRPGHILAVITNT